MKIHATDTQIILAEADASLTLLEKPDFPDYSNVTERPYITFYYINDESVWDRFRFCMIKLSEFCADDPYLGCYALLFRRLYPLLLSSSQAKNVIGYGLSTDSMVYRVYQDFMTFLQKGNALSALAQSPFSFLSLTEGSCHALLYQLDVCPALAAVCDAISKVKQGGLILLYTRKEALPPALSDLCGQAEKDSFGGCSVYALTMDEALADYALANSSAAFIQSRIEALSPRIGDLRNLTQAMLTEQPLGEDLYSLTALILQQTEEILLSLYDYLENDGLPVLANALKEAVLNYYVGIDGGYDLTTYIEKLTRASESFFAAVETEFSI